jgi:hypothetical protein
MRRTKQYGEGAFRERKYLFAKALGMVLPVEGEEFDSLKYLKKKHGEYGV